VQDAGDSRGGHHTQAVIQLRSLSNPASARRPDMGYTITPDDIKPVEPKEFKAYILFQNSHYEFVPGLFHENIDDAASDVAAIVDKMREFGFIIMEWWVV
jgi:hypothetical protein